MTSTMLGNLGLSISYDVSARCVREMLLISCIPISWNADNTATITLVASSGLRAPASTSLIKMDRFRLVQQQYIIFAKSYLGKTSSTKSAARWLVGLSGQFRPLSIVCMTVWPSDGSRSAIRPSSEMVGLLWPFVSASPFLLALASPPPEVRIALTASRYSRAVTRIITSSRTSCT